MLLFTEYKATQGALLSVLAATFGETTVTFINGDDRLDDVRMPDGNQRTLRQQKENAAEQFRAGRPDEAALADGAQPVWEHTDADLALTFYLQRA